MTGPRRLEGAVAHALTVPYALELPAGDPPPAGWPLLLALHGMGMRAATFADRVRPALPPGVALAVPQAPLPYETQRPDGSRVIRHTWYVYEGDSPEFRARLHQAADLVGALRTAILAGRPLDPTRLVLLGFSQGGYLAAVAALRDPSRWRGLAVCAARVKDEMLTAALPAARGFPVLLAHASGDTSISAEAPARGRAALEAHGARVTVADVPGPHAFGDGMAAAVRAWLATVLGA
jgi:phospholipase/carboxylesterase